MSLLHWRSFKIRYIHDESFVIVVQIKYTCQKFKHVLQSINACKQFGEGTTDVFPFIFLNIKPKSNVRRMTSEGNFQEKEYERYGKYCCINSNLCLY